MPPQNTILGSSIKIHGGDLGADSDWTLGCIAVKNSELKQIVDQIPKQMAMVEIYKSEKQAEVINREGYVNKKTLQKALELVKEGCNYTSDATAIFNMSYPMGDFDKSQGVCTDLAIRSLRGINIDLQALLYEDIKLNSGRYRISRSNTNIDHRRTRNLKIYFDFHALVNEEKHPFSLVTQTLSATNKASYLNLSQCWVDANNKFINLNQFMLLDRNLNDVFFFDGKKKKKNLYISYNTGEKVKPSIYELDNSR